MRAALLRRLEPALAGRCSSRKWLERAEPLRAWLGGALARLVARRAAPRARRALELVGELALCLVVEPAGVEREPTSTQLVGDVQHLVSR
eukprot:scaffold16675_cov58-Phaeocystis_antarctica.AAC.4